MCKSTFCAPRPPAANAAHQTAPWFITREQIKHSQTAFIGAVCNTKFTNASQTRTEVGKLLGKLPPASLLSALEGRVACNTTELTQNTLLAAGLGKLCLTGWALPKLLLVNSAGSHYGKSNAHWVKRQSLTHAWPDLQNAQHSQFILWKMYILSTFNESKSNQTNQA